MECLKNKKGVSPVIGVLLMVAVTVILAAIIASFIFGMGTKMKSAPQVQLYLEDAPGRVDRGNNELFIVTHYGGDDLNLKDIKLQVLRGASMIDELTWDNANKKFSGKYGRLEASSFDIRDGILSVGESFTVKETRNVYSSPVILTLRVIHIPTGTVIFEGSVRVQ